MSFKFLFFVSILSLASCSINREATSDFRDASDVTVRKIKDSVRVATGNVKLIDLQSFDSLLIDRTRVVREADSAEMAEFGINIQGQKKAYVVFEKEVRERVSQLKTHSADTLRVESSSSRRSLERDSTSFVSTVEKEKACSNTPSRTPFIIMSVTSLLLAVAVYLLWKSGKPS